MIELGADTLLQNPGWLAVLRAYHCVLESLAEERRTAAADASGSLPTEASNAPDIDEAAASGESPESVHDSDSSDASNENSRFKKRPQIWAPRLQSCEDISRESLSQIHGRLIAYGFLKCDLADAAAGVVYQLTPEGRAILLNLDENDRAAA